MLKRKGYTPKPKESGGSHIVFEKEGCRSIPVSTSNNIPRGTLRTILKEANISRDEFFQIW
ncbi:type II toxin-antitoxin system HicA family toxin [Methanobacterium spitsbergense]|uniref:Type II toxin-antitoxin system HicA family toxin n=1 Tax=Methanobacterium spitsbergense TaxID=2874285 RepID=A0A8T5UVU8_9EURY|nr:type II toxin-antitoxin system HicA family toxin [Methanobacterium spitsbergense]MBZ2166377.1 type II toxin-antitoxin system HicA family toxin [Methanobacterium spitsbergense]